MDSRPPFLIVKVGSTLPPIAAERGDFERWFIGLMALRPEDVRVVDVQRGEELPPATLFRGILVTGSASMVTGQAAWSERTRAWLLSVVEAEVPLLGVCYGHQLLADALGGEVGRNPRGREVGTIEVRLENASADPLLTGFEEPLVVQATHVESVLRIPQGACLLGSSRGDPHQIFRVGRVAWGVQFHPEMDAAIVREYVVARSGECRAEGLDPERLIDQARDSDHGHRLLQRFARLTQEDFRDRYVNGFGRDRTSRGTSSRSEVDIGMTEWVERGERDPSADLSLPDAGSPSPPRARASARPGGSPRVDGSPSGMVRRTRSERPPDRGLVPSSDLFINRELSWLEFNQRVLDEARNPQVPLLERLKFLAITQNNMDEFFMVRLAGLVEQRREGVTDVPADGMTPSEQIDAITRRVEKMYDEMGETFVSELKPLLEREGVVLTSPDKLDVGEQARLRSYFLEQVYPILTPLALDPGHPFPHVPNKRLHLIMMLSGEEAGEPAFAVVQVPDVLPRLISVKGSGSLATFVLLGDVIAENAHELFRGFKRQGAWAFRVVRNHDLSIDEEEAEDLLETIREEVRRRDRGRAVVLEVASACAPSAVEFLQNALQVDPERILSCDAPLQLPDMTGLGAPLGHRAALKDEPFAASVAEPFMESDNIFEVVRQQDVLLHHPYESFDPVVKLLEQAAEDPDVLAIKQTLYRTSGDSPIVKALMRAAESGKQVAALVEIKARFDEENNITWARRLEQSGVHVVYGLVGLKTHCKVNLIVRREGAHLRRYVHFGTGNYNPSTAKLYTDLSLFTCRPEFGEDATALFNLLTSCTPPRHWKKLIVAPLGLHETILGFIEREAAYARAGKPARVVAKMNSLQDPDVIQALYRASQAGVQIDLIVRGICCLRPGIPGVSENIRVRSIVDRFLEHSRICFFEAGGRQLVFGSSADWMPRNFHRRIEVMFPIENDAIRRRVIEEILGLAMEDNVKAKALRADGAYDPVGDPEEPEDQVRSQACFLERASRAHENAMERIRAERPFIVRPVRHRPTKSTTPSREKTPTADIDRPDDPV